MKTLSLRQLGQCRRCPRLVAFYATIAQRYPSYHAAPVPIWGDPSAHILIVGLAPGLHGAARTGRAFVGDSSGALLFEGLHALQLASSSDANEAHLLNVQITNAVKCLPPQNRPVANEINTCSSYLEREIKAMQRRSKGRPKAIICLGSVAYTAVQKLFRKVPQRFATFTHGANTLIKEDLLILGSYHPSRLNVNTGRMNLGMLQQVLGQAKAFVQGELGDDNHTQ